MQNEKFIPQRGIYRCKNNGVTLTELLVVIAIVGILVVALGFSFQGWIGKYNVEAQTKQIYFDLMDARARAMQFNRIYYVQSVGARSYSLIEDANDNSINDDLAIAGFPKPNFEYDITWGGAMPITFDKRGNITNIGTISIASTSSPDYDCIVIEQTRINMGQLSGGNCVAR